VAALVLGSCLAGLEPFKSATIGTARVGAAQAGAIHCAKRGAGIAVGAGSRHAGPASPAWVDLRAIWPHTVLASGHADRSCQCLRVLSRFEHADARARCEADPGLDLHRWKSGRCVVAAVGVVYPTPRFDRGGRPASASAETDTHRHHTRSGQISNDEDPVRIGSHRREHRRGNRDSTP